MATDWEKERKSNLEELELCQLQVSQWMQRLHESLGQKKLIDRMAPVLNHNDPSTH